MSEPTVPQVQGSRGKRLALSASLAGQLFSLLRNVIVARLLGPEEFGLAAVILLTLTFLDSLSNASAHNLLYQSKDEEAQPLMAAAHAVTITRALITSVLLVATTGIVTGVFGVALSPWALVTVAGAIFISGFIHHGIRLVQRDGDFRPGSVVQICADFAALAFAALAAWLTHSHVAIAFGLLGRHFVSVALSHVLARHPYRLSWDRARWMRFWQFGWPLLINGPLLFISAQADRMIITKELGVANLGIYAAVLLLVASPSTAIMRWLGTTNIPALAKHFREQGDLQTEGRVYRFTAQFLVLGYLMVVGFAALGPKLVAMIYGHRYVIEATAIALIGCLQIIRFLRGWPSSMSLSIGANTGILMSTVVRLLALPGAIVGFVLVGGLIGLLGGLVAGELLALLVSLWLLNGNAKRARTSGVASVALFVALTAVTISLLQVTGGGWGPSLAVACLMGGVGVPALALSVSRRESFALAQALLDRARRGG